MASDRDTVAEATGLSLREHQVAAAECDALADYLEHLAEIADGPLAANLASAYRSAALAVRGRAGRHRDPGVADPPQSSVVASAGHRMSDRTELRVPCNHSDDWVGRVQAGDLHSAPHCSVYTCLRCVDASREYVAAATGLDASGLILFERYLA